MDKITQHLQFIQKSSKTTCNYLSGRNLNQIQFFCLGLIRRINDISNSTLTLFKIIDENPNQEFAIGILFRTLTLDALISSELHELISDCEKKLLDAEKIKEKVNNYCEIVLSDGLNSTLNYIKMSELFGFTSFNETKKSYQSIVDLCKNFFKTYQNDGSQPILKYTTKINATNIFKKLASNAELKKLSQIFDCYTYYSKYDHFGILYYHTKNSELDLKVKMYTKATEMFIVHNTLIHHILNTYSNADQVILNQKNELNNYLLTELIG